MKTKLTVNLLMASAVIFLAGCVNTQPHHAKKTTPVVQEKSKIDSSESSAKQLRRAARKGDVVNISNALGTIPPPSIKDRSEALLIVVREMGRQKLTQESRGVLSYKVRMENGSTILYGDMKIQVKNLTAKEVEGFTEAIRVLLEGGADPNLLGFRGFVRTRYEEGFLRADPDRALKVDVGSLGEIVPVAEAEQTIMNVAVENGYAEALELLKKHGAVE